MGWEGKGWNWSGGEGIGWDQRGGTGVEERRKGEGGEENFPKSLPLRSKNPRSATATVCRTRLPFHIKVLNRSSTYFKTRNTYRQDRPDQDLL